MSIDSVPGIDVDAEEVGSALETQIAGGGFAERQGKMSRMGVASRQARKAKGQYLALARREAKLKRLARCRDQE